jgi:hypothetical protein
LGGIISGSRAARISDFVWEANRSSIPNSFADREPPTLIGLTSLRHEGERLGMPIADIFLVCALHRVEIIDESESHLRFLLCLGSTIHIHQGDPFPCPGNKSALALARPVNKAEGG